MAYVRPLYTPIQDLKGKIITRQKTYSIPVSVKGIVFDKDKVWLRKNEHKEWEIPGGKIDWGEQPEQTVVREVEEELGFEVKVLDIIQSNLHFANTPDESNGVLVIVYLCEFIKKTGTFETTGEHHFAEFKAFSLKEIAKLPMPKFYKDAIIKASKKKIFSKNRNKTNLFLD
jgi:mutator protein MutT